MAPKKSATKSTKREAPVRKSKVDPDETPKQKFVRLGKYRMSKTLNDLRGVKNLARYPHDPEQGAKIVEALQEAVTSIERSFSEGPTKERPTFDF